MRTTHGHHTATAAFITAASKAGSMKRIERGN